MKNVIQVGIMLLLLLMTMNLKAQSWQDDLQNKIRAFNTINSEVEYSAKIEEIDQLAINNPSIWQISYYSAFYRLQFLNRTDFKTEKLLERYLYKSDDLIDTCINRAPNEELYILKAYINLIRLVKTPEKGLDKYVTEIENSLQMADQFYFNHPRKLLIEGLYNYHYRKIEEPVTINRFQEFYAMAEEAFKVGVTKSYPMMPTWGKEICEGFLSPTR